VQLSAQTNEVTPGSEITVRADESIDLGKWDQGRIYSATVDRDVFARDGDLAIPRGSRAELIVRRIDFNAEGEIQDTRRSGIGTNQRTAKYVGGGALIGTIIGAIAGGGKGAAIGAGVGAASGAGAQVVTRGREIHITPESQLTYRLERSLYISDLPDNGYLRNGRHYHQYRDNYPEYRYRGEESGRR
jgi:hypothetical protein